MNRRELLGATLKVSALLGLQAASPLVRAGLAEQTTHLPPNTTIKENNPATKIYAPNIRKDPDPTKKGVALSYSFIEDVETVGAQKVYCYRPRCYWQTPEPIPWYIEVVPMVEHQRIPDDVSQIPESARRVMTFNEPEVGLPTRPVLSPSEGATKYHYLESLLPDKLLVSPAPVPGDLAWLRNFRNEYINQFGKPPRMDILSIHAYGNLEQCKSYVRDGINLANEWGIKEVWVSEWSFGTPEDVRAFALWMNEPEQSLVTGQFFYTNRQPDPIYTGGRPWTQNLFTKEGVITDLGTALKSVP